MPPSKRVARRFQHGTEKRMEAVEGRGCRRRRRSRERAGAHLGGGHRRAAAGRQRGRRRGRDGLLRRRGGAAELVRRRTRTDAGAHERPDHGSGLFTPRAKSGCARHVQYPAPGRARQRAIRGGGPRQRGRPSIGRSSGRHRRHVQSARNVRHPAAGATRGAGDPLCQRGLPAGLAERVCDRPGHERLPEVWRAGEGVPAQRAAAPNGRRQGGPARPGRHAAARGAPRQGRSVRGRSAPRRRGVHARERRLPERGGLPRLRSGRAGACERDVQGHRDSGCACAQRLHDGDAGPERARQLRRSSSRPQLGGVPAPCSSRQRAMLSRTATATWATRTSGRCRCGEFCRMGTLAQLRQS